LHRQQQALFTQHQNVSNGTENAVTTPASKPSSSNNNFYVVLSGGGNASSEFWAKSIEYPNDVLKSHWLTRIKHKEQRELPDFIILTFNPFGNTTD
jgi:hypothetical protein